MKKFIYASIVLLIILILVFVILLNISKTHMKEIGGEALSGYKENNKYYIAIDEKNFKEVNKKSWIVSRNLFISVLSIGALIVILIGVISFYYLTPLIFGKISEIKDLLKR